MTLVVIVVTLSVQGLTMPAVIRFARLPDDHAERDEERLAERMLRETEAQALDELADELATPTAVVRRVRRQHEDRQRQDELTGPGSRPDPPGSEGELRRALITRKREVVIRLRERGDIDDDVLRRLQHRLDLEELRVTPRDDD